MASACLRDAAERVHVAHDRAHALAFEELHRLEQVELPHPERRACIEVRRDCAAKVGGAHAHTGVKHTPTGVNKRRCRLAALTTRRLHETMQSPPRDHERT